MTKQFKLASVWIEIDGQRTDVRSVKAAKTFLSDLWPQTAFPLTTIVDEFRVIHVHQYPRPSGDMYPSDAVIVEDMSSNRSSQ